MSSAPLPGKPRGALALSALIVGSWWLVAHNSGAGWMQALGDVVFGTLLVGLAGPGVVLAATRLTATSAPADGSAGLPVELVVEASGRVRITPLSPPGPESFTGPGRGARLGGGSIVLLPGRRGVFETIRVEVATAAPFGLQWWTRRLDLALPQALHVAPRRGAAVGIRPASGDELEGGAPKARSRGGEPGSVQPYRPGDDRRRVHWPLSAHTGELMVRETDGTRSRAATVTVALPADPDEAERIAESAMGTVSTLLERGRAVVLVTTEPGGERAGPVADRHDAGRRLARAVHRSAPGGEPGVSVLP